MQAPSNRNHGLSEQSIRRSKQRFFPDESPDLIDFGPLFRQQKAFRLKLPELEEDQNDEASSELECREDTFSDTSRSDEQPQGISFMRDVTWEECESKREKNNVTISRAAAKIQRLEGRADAEYEEPLFSKTVKKLGMIIGRHSSKTIELIPINECQTVREYAKTLDKYGNPKEKKAATSTLKWVLRITSRA